ncbi:MAG TPA: hypothetical protein VIK04_13270 [Solirubrobacteraceae bacterium]
MSLQARFRALYGAGPLNLLVLVASFAIAAAAVVGWFQEPKSVVTVLLWFVAAIVLHDMVALPLYSLLDRIAFGRMPAGVRRGRRSVPTLVDPTPYLRIPAILSGLLLIVFIPVVFGLGTTTEESASGIPESGYAARWLLAVGVMFVASGVAYAVGTARARAAAAPAAPSDPAASPGPPAAPAPAAPSDPATPPNPPAPPPS